MLKRIVKMTFRPEETENFKRIFSENWTYIRDFEGCSHVELLQDEKDPRIFFTYSKWKDEASVENYRNSALFARVWSSTKVLFADKPEAWSVRDVQ